MEINTSKEYKIFRCNEYLLRLMIYWAETEKKHIQILNINVREYLRYIKNEYQSMHDMSDIV